MESDPSSRKQSIAIGYIFAAGIGIVCTENSIRVDDMTESPKLAE